MVVLQEAFTVREKLNKMQFFMQVITECYAYRFLYE